MIPPLLDGAMPVRGAAHLSSSSSAAIPSADKPSCDPAAVASAVSPHLPPTNSGKSLGLPSTVLFLRCANFGAHRLPPLQAPGFQPPARLRRSHAPHWCPQIMYWDHMRLQPHQNRLLLVVVSR